MRVRNTWDKLWEYCLLKMCPIEHG
jgi:hypothetical protein